MSSKPMQAVPPSQPVSASRRRALRVHIKGGQVEAVLKRIAAAIRGAL